MPAGDIYIANQMPRWYTTFSKLIADREWMIDDHSIDGEDLPWAIFIGVRIG